MPSIPELNGHRILYVLERSDAEWLWIDGLEEDGVAERKWMERHSNLLVDRRRERERGSTAMAVMTADGDGDGDGDGDVFDDEMGAISEWDGVRTSTVSEYNAALDALRRSVMESPLFPGLGVMGYLKEFMVTLCDWSNEGVLSIKYRSRRQRRSEAECAALDRRYGYYQRDRVQMALSPDGSMAAILFDECCVVRCAETGFWADLWRIALPEAFGRCTQFRCVRWSGHSASSQMVAVSSWSGVIVVYGVSRRRCDEVMRWNVNGGGIVAMGWRRRSGRDEAECEEVEVDGVRERVYWLELMALTESGRIWTRSVAICWSTATAVSVEEESATRSLRVRFPPTLSLRVDDVVFDGMDCLEALLVVSGVPRCLESTTPRQTRLGAVTVALWFETNAIDLQPQLIPLAHFLSTVPSNSCFSADSVCFTLSDRRCKLWGRSVEIADHRNVPMTDRRLIDGPMSLHILCLDHRANVELFELMIPRTPTRHQTEMEMATLRIAAKMTNSRPMADGPFPPQNRLRTATLFDAHSIALFFCDNTFTVTPIAAFCRKLRRQNKLNDINLLGPARQRLAATNRYPVVSRSAPIPDHDHDHHLHPHSDPHSHPLHDHNGYALRQFLVLEIDESYLRRKEDDALRLIAAPSNDIERAMNSNYGHRKCCKFTLNRFRSLTPNQLFQRALARNEHQKAIRIANRFNLRDDDENRKEFDDLVRRYKLKFDDEEVVGNEIEEESGGGT